MFIKKSLIGLTAGALLILSGCGGGYDYTEEVRAEFAQCLADEEIAMYGAFWCPHCADQKDIFGKAAFENVDYIECDPNHEDGQPELCLAMGIESYPTWERGDGERLLGAQTLEQLEEFSTCELPETAPAEEAA
jgi:thiol-disulfide isomerase/thioredoxin